MRQREHVELTGSASSAFSTTDRIEQRRVALEPA